MLAKIAKRVVKIRCFCSTDFCLSPCLHRLLPLTHGNRSVLDPGSRVKSGFVCCPPLCSTPACPTDTLTLLFLMEKGVSAPVHSVNTADIINTGHDRMTCSGWSTVTLQTTNKICINIYIKNQNRKTMKQYFEC